MLEETGEVLVVATEKGGVGIRGRGGDVLLDEEAGGPVCDGQGEASRAGRLGGLVAKSDLGFRGDSRTLPA